MIFPALWATAALFHLGKWSGWADSPANLALALSAAWVLLRPGAVAPLAALFAAQVWATAVEMPFASNHLLLGGLGGALGLLAIGRRILVERSSGVDAGALFRDFVPPARATFLLIFLLAGFHKLNTDWFRPDVSCGAALYRTLAERFPVLPDGTGPVWAAILGALVLELAVPFLLLTRRFRPTGVFLACAFLYAVGIAGFFNFASPAIALLFLFAPEDAGARLGERCARSRACRRLVTAARSPAARHAVRGAVIVLAVVAVVAAVARPWRMQDPILVRELSTGRRPALSYVFEAAWWVYGAGLVALLAYAFRAARTPLPSAGRMLAHPSASLAVVPFFVLLNGIAPYLGLKTEASFAMFSNLRTEAGSNHLVVRRPVDLIGLERDLVVIESSSDPELGRLAARGYLLPYVELLRYVRERTRVKGPDFSLAYVRGGERRQVERAGRDPELRRPIPLVARKFLAFRPVWPAEGSPCRH